MSVIEKSNSSMLKKKVVGIIVVVQQSVYGYGICISIYPLCCFITPMLSWGTLLATVKPSHGAVVLCHWLADSHTDGFL